MDRLRAGSSNLWGGTVGPDDNERGVYSEGPQPASPHWTKILKTPAVDEKVRGDTLPPSLAQMVLTRDGKLEQRLRRMLARARIATVVAQAPVETFVRRGLVPLRVGKGR